MFGPNPTPEPEKDNYFRPDTLALVQAIKAFKDELGQPIPWNKPLDQVLDPSKILELMAEFLLMENLHPMARGHLQGCVAKTAQAASSATLQEALDWLDKAALSAHHAGNL